MNRVKLILKDIKLSIENTTLCILKDIKLSIENTLDISHYQIEGHYPNVRHFPESDYSNQVIFI